MIVAISWLLVFVSEVLWGPLFRDQVGEILPGEWGIENNGMFCVFRENGLWVSSESSD